MIWATMDYDERLAKVAKLARDGNGLTTIARVLSTSNAEVWKMAVEHSVVIHGARPGHAVPDADDRGVMGSDPHGSRYEAWRRATEGARRTLEQHRLSSEDQRLSTEEILG